MSIMRLFPGCKLRSGHVGDPLPAKLLVLSFLAPFLPACRAQLPKILCLHGGGQSAAAFQAAGSMAALRTQLSSQFEFVYAQGPESGDLWIRDAPGGKGAGTTDTAWADTSVTYLDSFIAANGPFMGILGYSQGSAFATYYIARKQTSASAPFQFAMLFCGYIPTVHSGLAGTIDSASPFHGIPALVFLGARDFIITNALTMAQAGKFTSPTVITSQTEGHDLPRAGSCELADIVTWAQARAGAPEVAGPAASGGAATSACPTVAPKVANSAGTAARTWAPTGVALLLALGLHLMAAPI